MTIFKKVAFLRFLSDFRSQLACSNAIAASIEGCFAPPPVQGAQGPQRNTVAGKIGRQLGIQQLMRNFYKNEDISNSVSSFEF